MVPAVFDDSGVRTDIDGVARVTLEDRKMVCVFNSGETPWTLSVDLRGRSQVRDFWTDRSLGRRVSVKLTLPPHSARLLECTRG